MSGVGLGVKNTRMNETSPYSQKGFFSKGKKFRPHKIPICVGKWHNWHLGEGSPMGGTQKRESTRSNQEESFEGDPSVIFCYANCFNKKVCVLKYNDN